MKGIVMLLQFEINLFLWSAYVKMFVSFSSICFVFKQIWLTFYKIFLEFCSENTIPDFIFLLKFNNLNLKNTCLVEFVFNLIFEMNFIFNFNQWNSLNKIFIYCLIFFNYFSIKSWVESKIYARKAFANKGIPCKVITFRL